MKNVYRSHSILGPVYFNLKYANGDYETRFLHLIYAKNKMKGRVVKSVFPFYYHQHDSIGNSSSSFAFSFYNKFKIKVPNTDVFYKEIKIFWFIRLRSNYQYLKSKGIIIVRKRLK